MTAPLSNNNVSYPSVRETIRRFDMLGELNGFSSISIKSKTNNHSSPSISLASRSTGSEFILSSNEIEQETTVTIDLQPDIHQKRLSIISNSHINNGDTELVLFPIYASPAIIYGECQFPPKNNSDDIGLEVIESVETQQQSIIDDKTRNSLQSAASIIEDYEENDIQQQSKDVYRSVPLPRLPPPLPPLPHVQEESNYQSKRSLLLSIFLLEIAALLVVFILCMVLVLAIRENQANLRTTMQIVYTYIYLVSIIWMIWCTYDIIKFRQHWMKLTSSAHNQEEYMDIVERSPDSISYFPDIHNNGGLFMRCGAGLLCMGSLLLTVIELAKTVETIRTDPIHHKALLTNYSKPAFLSKSITYIFRFVFHCVQFTFLFRYGNIIIDRYHFIAKIGLIHIVIANFCTWFEAIVIETLEQLHKHSSTTIMTNAPVVLKTTTTTKTMTSESVKTTAVSQLPFDMTNFLKDIAAAPAGESTSTNTTTNALEFIGKIESLMGAYLYPFLIEYSLISVTVFYIMWRNVGKTENRSFLHFSDRHIFTVNCSRASYGLLIGGIILILTILTLIPAYVLDLSSATPVTHMTELVLLIFALLIVCPSFFYTTKLYYDRQAHVDIFDQILILITTVGDFAYSFFGLFASIFIQSYTLPTPRGIEIAIGVLAIFQTFLQSGFILDALKRRIVTKNEIRRKPGRQLVTALLLINLAIWMHDSLSAKKVKLNPLQTDYYDGTTWLIVQAFTSPLSIFYRFHSSVCLADIWQEVYRDHKNQHGRSGSDRLTNSKNNHM